MTSLSYQKYSGVTVTANKRFSNKWQLNGSVTRQTNPGYNPLGSFTNPTGIQFSNGFSTISKYLIKLNGSYQLPWQLTASANLNWNAGGSRTRSINGPCSSACVFNGVGQSLLNLNSLSFENNGSVRFQPNKLLDIGVQKVIPFRGGKNRVKLTLDGFNIFNISTIQGYSSNNLDSVNFTVPSSIVPPRVFRIGGTLAF
jgi:hypothetical protein